MTLATEKHLFANLEHVAARAVDIRHDLHRHPELGYQETYTSSVVQKELARLNIEFTTGHAGGTGVVGLIKGAASISAKNGGGCVALRADMDALPITETTNLPYASTKPGLMHACGHDGHTAVLLGAAAILAENRHRFPGTVKLLFQPAEEGGCGAEKMANEGALDNPKVDAIFGLHGWPGLKVGMVATRPGPLLAAVDGFTITITGRGGHAAAPQDCIDPIPCAAAIVQALQTVISRETDPSDAAVLSVTQFNAGTTFNVISDRAELVGTIRALSKTRHNAIIASLERISRGIAAAHRCEIDFTYFGTTPVTSNTPELADFLRDTASRALGSHAFIWASKPAMWGEDFAFYLERVPGCFFVLGVQPHDRDSYPMLHNPNYDFTDDAVPVGIRMMTELAIGYLNRPT
ncbi:MAG TPA: M20 family metallopeptidase [Phycisphaerae bacterium]|nr:M20 family metallopeptidase [Phycisphaerae bacterium]